MRGIEMRVMGMAGLTVLLTALMLGSIAAGASAATIQFTVADSDSGTLNGNAFATANFVITSLADTANRSYLGNGVYAMDNLSSNVSITGLGDFDILTGTRTFLDTDGNRVGLSRAGADGLDLMLGPENIAFASWSMLSAIGPLSGSTYGLEQWSKSPQINTTGGILIFNDGGGTATFTAAILPEPATLTMLAFGGVALLRRRRK